jgi:large subunit ribosomal protein L23
MTEKSVRLQETENTYNFEVARSANKVEIKRAIETTWDVEVEKVRVVSLPGKLKRMGRFIGRRPATKKAMVTLKEGHTLDLFENV